MSTVESLDSTGCPFNPTKSLCCPSVFNTAITRAKSLIVAVGNPYVLMHTEMKMQGNEHRCWAEYLQRCFKTKTVLAREGIDIAAIEELQQFVDAKLRESVPVQKAIEESPTRTKDQKLEHEASFQYLQQQLKYEQDSSKEKKREIYQLQKQVCYGTVLKLRLSL